MSQGLLNILGFLAAVTVTFVQRKWGLRAAFIATIVTTISTVSVMLYLANW